MLVEAFVAAAPGVSSAFETAEALLDNHVVISRAAMERFFHTTKELL